jgi:hypothetical protein
VGGSASSWLSFLLLRFAVAAPWHQPTLDLLEQHDPDAAASMRSVLKLPRQQYLQLLQVEQLPSSMSREQFVTHGVRQLLRDDVHWQLEAVKQGFAAGTNIQVSADAQWSACEVLVGPIISS